jgi:uncharacterized delta-60 repeat protein
MLSKVFGLHFLGILMCVVILAGCNGGGTPVAQTADQISDLPESSMSSGQSRDVIAVYDAVIDPVKQTFMIEPSSRDLSYHGALTRLYPNALTITDYGWSPNFWVDITLTHPLPNSGIIVFDPRVIAILPTNPGLSFNYPVLDCVGNNSAVLEPDGYTKLFDSLGGSIPGNTNPFKAYFKDQPNRRWMDQGVTSETQRWQMNLSGMPIPLQYKLVVDISTNYPQLPTPGVDNAPEPVQIEATVEPGLTPQGGEAQIEVTLLDWQGQSSIGGVRVEAPDLFDGTVSLAFSEPGPNPNEYVYTGTIANSLLAPAGEYRILVATWDQQTNLCVFNEFTVTVIEPLPPTGNLVWAKSAGGEGYDRGVAITTLSDNSTVVTGEFWGTATFGPGETNETILTAVEESRDVFIAKYNPDGTLAWAKHAGGARDDLGYGITTLSDDSTVVTGDFYSTATFGSGETNETVLISELNEEIFIAKYNPDGTLAWAKRAGGSDADRGYGITTLSDDSTVVTGDFSNTATFGPGESNETILTAEHIYSDIFIAKYNPDGSLAWAKRAGGRSVDYGYGISTLSDNSTVVTGLFQTSATFGPGEPNETILTCIEFIEVFIARYNPDGSLAWAKCPEGQGADWSGGITALSDDSAVVSGYFYGSVTFGLGENNETVLTSDEGSDVFIARYNPDGTLVWAKHAGGPNTNYGYGITTLSDNSIVATGRFSGPTTFGPGELNETVLNSDDGLNIFLARFNPDGTLVWAKCVDGSDSGIYYMEISLTSLSDNSTVATGYFQDPATFGPGESNETILNSNGNADIFVARFEQ